MSGIPDEMRPQSRSGELYARVGAAGARSHHVLSLAELLALGLSERSVRRWVALGRLHALHQGVYAVGRADVSANGQARAAILACGPASALSHRWAGRAWGLLSEVPREIEVTSTQERRRAGVRCYRTRSLPATQVTVRRGIPVTTVTRTLIDLSAVLPLAHLEDAIHAARLSNRLRERELREHLQATPRRPGSRQLRDVLGESSLPRTRSRLERRFLRWVRTTNLPVPELNVEIALGEGSFEVDAIWTDRRVVVELQSHRHHGTRHQIDRDSEKSLLLQAAGYACIPVTWTQLDDPRELERHLGMILSDSSIHLPPT